ncbi:hypothetical protein SDC9_142862 [bioreactor metagenome]|uniref:Uncharacterized protein n=1 Tax=bioreactor metagenome TaxID=1076179 RepID=A0A645E205_9ZZZZ
MISHGSGDDDGVACLRILAADGSAGRYPTKTGGVDKKAVGFAFFDHFGIPGHNGDATFPGGICHGADDPMQGFNREAFF